MWYSKLTYIELMDLEDSKEAGKKLSFKENITVLMYKLHEEWRHSKLNDWAYAAKCYLFKRYDLIRTRLDKTHWYDKDTLILHGLCELVVDYVEKEKCFETIDFTTCEEDKKRKSDIEFIYNWWKNYPNRQQEIKDSLDAWYTASKFPDVIDWTKNVNKQNVPSPEADELHKLHTRLEEDLCEEEQAVLHKIIDIRRGLWT